MLGTRVKRKVERRADKEERSEGRDTKVVRIPPVFVAIDLHVREVRDGQIAF